MKTFLAVLLASSLAFAEPPASDAPAAEKPVVLTPAEAKAEAVRVLTCEKDLGDCKAEGKVSPLWLIVGIAAGVAAGFGIGYGVAQVKR
jgi:hypothetical protein